MLMRMMVMMPVHLNNFLLLIFTHNIRRRMSVRMRMCMRMHMHRIIPSTHTKYRLRRRRSLLDCHDRILLIQTLGDLVVVPDLLGCCRVVDFPGEPVVALSKAFLITKEKDIRKIRLGIMEWWSVG